MKKQLLAVSAVLVLAAVLIGGPAGGLVALLAIGAFFMALA